ncbi:MAG: hypothetical protein JXR58_05895 [Bacteroidales bacterium]|nr:hypothetical protein [Bacteroidales bacterium]
MSNTDNLKKISIELQEVIEIIDRIKHNGFAQIEKDLVLQKLRTVYEDFYAIKEEIFPDDRLKELENENEELEIDENDLPDIEVKILVGDEAPEGEVVVMDRKDYEMSLEKEQVVVEDIIVAQVEENSVEPESEIFEIELEEESLEEPKVEKSEEILEQTNFIFKDELKRELKEEEPAAKQSQTVADQFQNGKKSLNDLAAVTNKVRDLASKLKDQPISDLKKAINLNDRFLFTKELFEGNAVKYNQSIEDLNNFSNLDQAMEYINAGMQWDMEKESFKKFVELVYRRYM